MKNTGFWLLGQQLHKARYEEAKTRPWKTVPRWLGKNKARAAILGSKPHRFAQQPEI